MAVDEMIYEGKAKNLYLTDEKGVLKMVYKDQATALNGKRKEEITGKGRLNRKISNLIFDYLTQKGIETHLLENLSETEQLVKKVEIVPLEVVLRNVVAGSFAKKFGQAEGTFLADPVLEYYYKSDELDDPAINLSQIHALKLASKVEMAMVIEQTLRINQFLKELFSQIEIELIDFKLEFGRYEGRLILADEFSPDNCRLWDKKTHKSLDKDVFRKKQGDLVSVYQEVLNRLTAAQGGN